MQPAIGFYVCYSHIMSSGSTIPFNIIKTNLGNSWSSSYHRFTAPVKGLYYFTLHIMTLSTASQYYAGALIMHANVNLCFVYASRSSNVNSHIPASGSAVVMLNAGELVWARRRRGYLYSNGDLYTHFVGFLIQQVK